MNAPRRQSPLEKDLQRQIEAAIGSEPDLLLLRNSVGEAVYYTGEGQQYHVPYGLGVGSPDLVGILRVGLHLAAWFCLEVKTDDGVVSDEQEKCHRVWRRFGALVYVVRSVDDARRALTTAREAVAVWSRARKAYEGSSIR